jgi:predicted AlkP superfamily pyrophosphatase or phosphodiesterase
MARPTSLRHRRWWAGLLLVLLAGAWALRAQTPPPPIVVLVSLDGFRWDYLDRGNVPNLRALAARGVRADALIPSYPTFTFPNHYTLVTGLVPDHHGIVGNYMTDPAIGPQRFSMWASPGKDPRWWGGEPIWTTAMRRGLKTAAMFWPGADARPPTYTRPYDASLPNLERVRQVLDWLALPDATRPAFITLMFTEADDVGHDAGPDSPEMAATLGRLDQAVGILVAGIERLGLTTRTTLVVVSDHGMMSTSERRLIFLDDYLSAGDADVVEAGANLALNPAPGRDVDTLYTKLARRHPSLPIYRRADVPPRLRYGSNPRVPAVVGIPDAGWLVTTHLSAASRLASGPWRGGAHGYDPRTREMHGVFIAVGPGLRLVLHGERPFTRGLEELLGTGLSVHQVLAALLGGRQSLGDAPRPFLDGPGNLGPQVLHCNPYHEGEDAHLRQNRCIQIHAAYLAATLNAPFSRCP